jgi:hypothetical protein
MQAVVVDVERVLRYKGMIPNPKHFEFFEFLRCSSLRDYLSL